MKPFLTMSAAVVALLATASMAEASRPVRKTITGCVSSGRLTSDNGYYIRVRESFGGPELDLGRYNGRRIRVRGLLSPGDRFVIESGPDVLGPCGR